MFVAGGEPAASTRLIQPRRVPQALLLAAQKEHLPLDGRPRHAAITTCTRVEVHPAVQAKGRIWGESERCACRAFTFTKVNAVRVERSLSTDTSERCARTAFTFSKVNA